MDDEAAGDEAAGDDADGEDGGGDAGADDAGGEEAGGDDAGGGDAGGDEAGGDDAGGDEAGGEDPGGLDAGGEDAGGVPDPEPPGCVDPGLPGWADPGLPGWADEGLTGTSGTDEPDLDRSGVMKTFGGIWGAGRAGADAPALADGLGPEVGLVATAAAWAGGWPWPLGCDRSAPIIAKAATAEAATSPPLRHTEATGREMR